MAQRYYIQTFGCQMNEYDSAKMADVLADKFGASPAAGPDDADILLVNTCSIREKAAEKVFSLLGRWRALKESRPGTIIGVGGCVASQEGEGILERAPFVDLVFGPQTLHRLPELISAVRGGHTGVVDVSFPEIEKFDRIPEPKSSHCTAFLSVMEGCSKYCTYCVVPYTRGEEISRPLDDVIAEAYRLAELGVKEVNLLGQNVNAYRGATHDGGKTADLATLIHYVAAIEGIERIRFTTSHPVEFTDALIDAYASVPKLAGFLHLPVQSGSDRILALMKRGHTREQYVHKMDKLKEARPGISISSDFIVGFPGETEQDFEATLELIRRVGFDQSFSFIYSPRPGTPAAALDAQLPRELAQQRLDRLQRQVNEQAAAVSRAMVGTPQRVLVERVSVKSSREVAGRTENNRWVNFIGSPSLIGEFVDVQITEALTNSLRGRALRGRTFARTAQQSVA
ncbi:MAG TPA: tRNA (N6-isopentenyl adenosine(37)-C2)-methylthiotransferase MiaB [Gammaproteobacteria bacterium]|nr:tRNA (N6-isopentenyl adenosine(37)-C2)-methylthiotransferase MiaB [Gammaproteobacteria bacterium]